MSNHSSRKSSKNYKKKEDYIEYRFSNNDGESKNKPFLDVGISVEKIRKVFAKLQEIFGENNELIKEYSVYKHNDMKLTVFPDGSSFCRQVSVKEVKDTTTPDGIIVTYKEKLINVLTSDLLIIKNVSRITPRTNGITENGSGLSY